MTKDNICIKTKEEKVIPKCFKNCLNFITIMIMSMIPGAITLPGNNNPHIMDSNPASIPE